MARPTADANIALIKWAKSFQHWRFCANFLSSESPIQNTIFLAISTKMYRTRRKISKYFSKSLPVPLRLSKFIWKNIYIWLQKSPKECSFLRDSRWDPGSKLETSCNNYFLNVHIPLCRVYLLRNKCSQTDNQSHLHLLRDMHLPLSQGIYVTVFFSCPLKDHLLRQTYVNRHMNCS